MEKKSHTLGSSRSGIGVRGSGHAGKLKPYVVQGTLTISAYTIVRATSPREAAEKASGRSFALRTGDPETEEEEWVTSGDDDVGRPTVEMVDGEPCQ